jgi:hypothetical protein
MNNEVGVCRLGPKIKIRLKRRIKIKIKIKKRIKEG